MTKILLVLVLVASACGPVPASTRCGLGMLEQSADWLTIEKVQEAEDQILQFVQGINDDRINSPQKTCAALKWGSVYGVDEKSWIDRWGRDVSGLTYCPERIIVVARPWELNAWQRSALAHELIHWIQRCEGTGASTAVDIGHENWHEDGVYSTLERINALNVSRTNP